MSQKSGDSCAAEHINEWYFSNETMKSLINPSYMLWYWDLTKMQYWHFNSIKWSHQFHLLQILSFDSKAIQQNVAIAKKIHFLYANSENYTIVVILEECISTHTGGESDFKSHLFFVTGCIIDCFSIRHPLRNDGCGK